MKAHLTGTAVALLLTVACTLPGRAEESAQPSAPAASPSTPAATPTDAPATVPRPSIAPKNAAPAQQPVAPQADDGNAPRRRHYARRVGPGYGTRTAYWQPFPIYLPHFYHSRIYWSRMRWFF
jgi:hypothetical protein